MEARLVHQRRYVIEKHVDLFVNDLRAVVHAVRGCRAAGLVRRGPTIDVLELLVGWRRRPRDLDGRLVVFVEILNRSLRQPGLATLSHLLPTRNLELQPYEPWLSHPLPTRNLELQPQAP